MVRSERGRRPIHVAFFLDGMGIGGTELNAVRTAERLDRERFQLSVFCNRPAGPLLERYRAADVPVIATPIDGFASLSAVRQARRVTGLLREMAVDIVHCHDIYSNVFGTTCGRLAGVPAVLTSRRWWKASPNRPLRHANRLAYRASHHVLANSAAVGRLVVETDGVRDGKVAVITNFVDEASYDRLPEDELVRWRARLGIASEAFVVGVVANLRPVKDHATVLRAFADSALATTDVHLLLVGDGPLRASLTELATSLKLADRVHFAGHLPSLPNPHQLFDVSVLCSSQEGFPNSILEAMAAERPVVATDVGGIPDAVDDGTTGVLVPVGDSRALGAALERLRREPALRRSMGLAGAAFVRERFSATTVLPSLEALYDTLASRSPRR